MIRQVGGVLQAVDENQRNSVVPRMNVCLGLSSQASSLSLLLAV